jgi:hypothetical protein
MTPTSIGAEASASVMGDVLANASIPDRHIEDAARLVGVVVMGHSAHRAIAGYARPPRAPRLSLCGGPRRAGGRLGRFGEYGLS